MRPLRFTIDHLEDDVVALTVVGKGPISMLTLMKGLEASVPHLREFIRGGGRFVLRDALPEHFREWGAQNRRQAKKLPITTDLFDATVEELAYMGQKRPSPEWLIELVDDPRPRARSIAVAWMAGHRKLYWKAPGTPRAAE